jgi:hypothetical protein
MDEVKGGFARVARTPPAAMSSVVKPPTASGGPLLRFPVPGVHGHFHHLHMCLASVQVAMRTLVATHEIRQISIELIERLLSFGIEGQRNHCVIAIGPFPMFGW